MSHERLNTGADARPASRKIAAFLVGTTLVAILPAGALAQQPSADSLAERLRRAEAAIAALQAQMAEQAEGATRARSGAHLELNGRVMVGGFGNSRRVNNVDNPQFVRPDTAPGLPVRGVGMAIRQTRLGLAVRVTPVLRGVFTGDVDVDFYGGQQPSSGGRTFPLVRLRTARGMVRWRHADLLVGQEMPLISGVNPITPAAIGTPEFAGAGNLWLWLPQVRAGIHTSGAMRVGFQAAVLAPTSGDAVAAFDTDYDLAERSARPFVQGRVSATWDDGNLVRDVGCGVHEGWLVPVATRVTSRAFACDATIPVLEQVELRGELFVGQALRGLGGGAIGQNLTPASDPLKTKGGWAQVNAHPSFSLRFGAGCGIDHPDALAVRRRNDACSLYALRSFGPLFAGAEWRRLRTEYTTGRYSNDHVTLALGFEF